MTPLPDKYLNQIICGDALEVMRGMPDKCVDLVLTDPPYGIGESNEKNATRGHLAYPRDYGHYEWNKSILSIEYLDEIRRVSKNQIVFGGNYYPLPPSSCWIVWDKDNSGDFADCELAWTSFKTAVRKFKWRWNGMLQQNMRDKEIRIHPTQKPVPLFRWILSKYSKDGQIILDPFLGSGTTAVAAVQLNRQYIGIEINPEYCEMARARIARETAQRTIWQAMAEAKTK